ncbi:CD209 antigen-like protein A isoform X1 [Alosa sapidissima]|uniref:CD209 antigen-like protein A isoform X1 n=1 Tax=Alosa sapidissima TaxID=34773 RepID=UPI001C0A1277|nr:CD209 antigen-like protein A isoform X1 [Alosa sapidissima]
MEMEELISADRKPDDKDVEESAEIPETDVIEAAEGGDEDETNVYSKLQNPSEDVYETATLAKQPQKHITNFSRFRLFRAVTAILSVICLILLVVIIALAMKLQMQSICPDRLNEGENIDVSSVCTLERCLSIYPQRQVHTSTCHKCGKDWVEFEGFCFLLSRERLTWSESRSECRRRGGYLAVPDQDRVQNFLSQVSKSLHWIGLSRSRSGAWLWVDNSTLGKSNWSEQPGEADCVYLNGEAVPAQSWTTAKCSAVTYYICQKDR